jgi:hypothetical protein
MNADLFGDRPSLNSRIQNTDSAIGFVCYSAGAIAAELLLRTGPGGARLSFFMAAGCTAICAALPWTMDETLPPSKRKAFTLVRANPLANLLLLVRNGPGLRRLTASTALFFTTNACWGTMVPFRMGVLRWTALDISRFGLVVTPFGSLASQSFVNPLIRRIGNRRAFQRGAVAGALAWTLCGQCWRVFGVGNRRLVWYTGALYVALYIANLFGAGWPGAPATCQVRGLRSPGLSSPGVSSPGLSSPAGLAGRPRHLPARHPRDGAQARHWSDRRRAGRAERRVRRAWAVYRGHHALFLGAAVCVFPVAASVGAVVAPLGRRGAHGVRGSSVPAGERRAGANQGQ